MDPKPPSSAAPSPQELNRLSWNAAVPAHNRHKGDQAAFFRAGGDTLFPEEVALLGTLAGRRLAHLQCNCGQDSLSLARRGAVVTGVDISDAAVAFAETLSLESGVPARFVRSDLYDWLFSTPERFDVAFASYGTYGWLPDLDAYFRGVARILSPGGRYVLLDFHPAAWIFDRDWTVRYPYSSHGIPLEETGGVNDYVAHSGDGLLHGAPATPDSTPFQNPHPTREFCWGLADILGGVLRAGLALETFTEYPFANGCKVFEPMKALPGRRWTVPDGRPELPLMFGVGARRA